MNINQLHNCNMQELVRNLSVQEVDGDLLSYANLLVERESGKILKVSRSLFDIENAINIPLAIRIKDFRDKPLFFLEALFQDLMLPISSRTTIEDSLRAFNALQIKA